MADFSASGIYGLPATTADTLAGMLRGGGDPRVLGWCHEAVQEGDRINRSDPSFEQIEVSQNYVTGMQGGLGTSHVTPSGSGPTPGFLPRIVLNESRKAMQAHVSALTDLRPTFGFKSTNPAFTFQQHLLNQLVVSWWISTMADIELGEVIKNAFVAGTGDCVLEWDPYTGDGGNNLLKARDCRDTLPIRPSQHHDIQLWQGLTLREEHTVNVLRTMYPQYGEMIQSSSDTVLAAVAGRFRTAMARLISPAADTLSGLTQHTHSQKPRSGTLVLYRTYLADQSKNLTNKPLAMGDPTASWAYVVKPGDRLYPNKRLIVWCEKFILYDGPSTYTHGMYPLSRLRLWSLPWLMLGVPILNDLTPLQDGINETLQDLRLGIRQWLHRSVKYNRADVSESTMRLFDSRKPGARIKMNAGANAEGMGFVDGPNPQVLALAHEFLKTLREAHDTLSGTANLTQLMQLRQMPSADTIQKYYEALTPEIRYEGRMVEGFLRSLAEQWKVNTFQFMTAKRRIAILGDAGLSLQDFDYDPGTLVPAMSPMKSSPGQPDPLTGMEGPPTMAPDPQYVPELDASRPYSERAQHFQKLFVFTVAPNSLLAMNTQEGKMMRFQLARMGYYDFWSLHETLETPNVGTPPAIPLPPLTPPTPEEVMQAQLQAGAAALGVQIPGMAPAKYIMGPDGQILEIRVPMTVTERLMAQQMLGIGMTENPAGRKASGQESPKSETKSDGQGGQRQTTTESAK